MTTKKPARPSVKLVAGHATTTSTALAQFFVKRHNDVLRSIDTLIKSAPPDKADWCLRNFAQASREVEQPNGGKATYTEYQITRDGFTLLAMGFTGKEAFAWKIKYIEAFNHLEARAADTAAKTIRRKVLAEQAAERRKLLLSAPEPKGIDVRRLLLEGQSDPTLPLPAEIHSAINRRAWTMAHEVYELLREHLARRVAYTSEMGMPRYLNAQRALEVIAASNINTALAHSYHSELRHCAALARSALNISTEFNTRMQKALEGK